MGDYEGVRAYFSPCGIGLGHVGRSLPVAEEMIRRGGEVMFSTYLEGVDYVKRKGLPVVASPALSLASDSTGRIDLKATAATQGVQALPRFMQQITMEMEYMKSFRPDVVISDSRLSSVVAGKILGLPVALMLNQFMPVVPREKHNLLLSKIVDGGILTLLSMGWGASDVILIPDFPDPYTISLGSLRIPKQYRHLVRMVGFILPRKPENIKDNGRVRDEAGATKEERLIFAAISGPLQERLPLVKLLRPFLERLPGGYKAVMSLGDPDGVSEPVNSGSLTTIPWVVDRYEYLKACDLVVCRGGHNTIMQCISYGKPSIVIPTPNQTEQYVNARRAAELGFSIVLHQKDLSMEKLLESIDEMLNDYSYTKNLKDMGLRGYTEGIENTLTEVSKLISG